MKKFKRILSFLLTLIIVLSCLMITAYADEINSSSPSGSSVVEYSVDPGWKATIPAYVKATDQGQQDPSAYTVTIYDVLLGDQQKLVATIDYDGILEEENGIQLKYSLYDSEGKIESEKKFAEIPAGDPDEEYTYTFGAALDEKPKYAGNYLGTVMFNLAVEDIYYTAEEIEKNPLLFPIGKTVPEYVVAEFRGDSVTVFKNGKDSDGIMRDWGVETDIHFSPFCDKRGSLKNVEIKGNVKNIGNFAFNNCVNVEKIVLGHGIESIGVYSFGSCSSLSEIIIPNSIINIGDSAFDHCNSLLEIIIPDSVKNIETAAFWYCRKLSKLSLGKGVNFIGDCAFAACSSLTSVSIPDSVTSMGEAVFSDCVAVEEFFIGRGLKCLPSGFTNSKALTSITVPQNIESIGEGALLCNSLMDITIEGMEVDIDVNAFDPRANLTFYGHTGSTTEAFAQSKGYTFIALEE